MSFTIGTVRCQCANVMGMPHDSGKCRVCGEENAFWGERSLSRLEAWATEHSETHKTVENVIGDASGTHVIERTSPKGEKFLGRCTRCERDGLTLADGAKTCPGKRNLSVYGSLPGVPDSAIEPGDYV